MIMVKPAWCLVLTVSLATGVAAASQKDQQKKHPQKATKTEEGVNNTKPGSNPTIKSPGISEQEFLKEAAIGDMFEIQTGQLAEQNGSSQQVKDFGKRMVRDHSQDNDLVKGIAQAEHVALPSELDPKHKSQKAGLEKKKGSAFDKAYTALMVQDHEQTVKKFQREASSAHDPTIKKYAQGALPILQSHLNDAKKAQSEVNAPGNPKK